MNSEQLDGAVLAEHATGVLRVWDQERADKKAVTRLVSSMFRAAVLLHEAAEAAELEVT